MSAVASKLHRRGDRRSRRIRALRRAGALGDRATASRPHASLGALPAGPLDARGVVAHVGCYPLVLAPLAALLLVRRGAFRPGAGASSSASSSCCSAGVAADLFQHLFARPRRLDWVVKHERAFSYPSSHAAIATGFYALWAVMLSSRICPLRQKG